jgi:hypothetical protein
MSLAALRVDRAAELLKGYGVHHEIARAKVGYLRAAAWWFRWALALLVLLVVLVLAYVIAVGQQEPESPTCTHPTECDRTMSPSPRAVIVHFHRLRTNPRVT